MRAVIAMMALWWAMAAPAAAQCCGDCAGDGNVTIDDLIRAVNNALNGCAPGAPCCGDCAGDGSVTIDDLIRAVNNALNGCSTEATPTSTTAVTPGTPTRTPTPTRTATSTRKPTNTRKPTATPTPIPTCRSNFSTQGSNLCLFNGTYNRGCGNALGSTFSSNGRTLLVTIATGLIDPPTISFAASVTNATNASLTAWSTDNFQTTNITRGAVRINGGGQQLEVFPNDPPFDIQGCFFVQYLGSFVPSRSAAAVFMPTDDATPIPAPADEHPPE